MSGYDVDRFVDKVTPQFICQICKCVVNEPVQCNTCNQLFCEYCLTEFQLKYQKCFNSCLSFDVFIPSQQILSELEMFRLRCMYQECGMLVLLKSIKKHEQECEYKTSECPQCNQSVIKKKMQKHLNETCDYKVVTCTTCNQVFILKDYKQHNCYLLELVNNQKNELQTKDQKIKQLQTQIQDLNQKVEKMKIKLEHKNIKLQIQKQKKLSKRIKREIDPNHRPRAGSTDVSLKSLKVKQQKENTNKNQQKNANKPDQQCFRPQIMLEPIQEMSLLQREFQIPRKNLSDLHFAYESYNKSNNLIYFDQPSFNQSSNKIQDFYDSDVDSGDEVPQIVKQQLQERALLLKKNSSSKVDQKRSSEKS